MIACLSPNGQNLNHGNAAPTKLLVATLRGITVLERAQPGAAWTIAAASSTASMSARS